MKLLKIIACLLARRNQRQQILKLDEWVLRDIGASRSDLMNSIGKCKL